MKKVLIIGNRLIGDAIDGLHTIHSIMVHYSSQGQHTATYGFLGYRYSAFVHTMLTTDLNVNFQATYYLEDYLAPPQPQSTSKHWHKIKDWLARYVKKERQQAHYPRVNVSWRALITLVRLLRNERYDEAWIMPGGMIFAIVTYLAGIKCRIGHATDGRSLWLTHRARISKRIPNFKNWARLLNALTPPLPFHPYHPKPRAFSSEKTSFFALSSAQLQTGTNEKTWQQCYVIAAQASEPWRSWNKFSALASELARHYHFTALWVGMAVEYATIETLRSTAQGKLGLNLAGKLSWDELLALLGSVRFLVTNDTGIAHIGTLLCPTFVLFGPSNPTMAMPYTIGDYFTKIVAADQSIPDEQRKEKRHRAALAMEQIAVPMVVSAIKQQFSLQPAQSYVSQHKNNK